MSSKEKAKYAARFKPEVYKELCEEADSRGVSVRQVLDDAINVYFKTKGSKVWQKTLSSGQN